MVRSSLGLNQFSAAIFDMDGLLLDSEVLALEAFQATCEDLSLGDLSELFKQCIGTNSELGASILRSGLNGSVEYETFSTLWNKKHQALTQASPIPLKTGVEGLILELIALKIPLAVATSTQTDKAKLKLESSGILQHFSIVVGGDQVQKSKPAPDIYLEAASKLLIEPINCIAFEDSNNGVRAAVSARMTVVQIPDLVEPDDELIALGHIVLKDLTEVSTYSFKK